MYYMAEAGGPYLIDEFRKVVQAFFHFLGHMQPA
jgi:hypothetical protein